MIANNPPLSRGVLFAIPPTLVLWVAILSWVF